MITFARTTIIYWILKKVVITGGPSTGKTSVIENLEKKWFSGCTRTYTKYDFIRKK
ncbi:AAA family ATPase [Zobellia nedashkovskayae]